MSYAHQVYSKSDTASPAIAAAFARTRRRPKCATRISPEGIMYNPKVFKAERRRGAKSAWSTTLIFTGHALASPEFGAMVDAAVNIAVARWSAVSRKVEFVKRGADQGRSFLRLGDERVWLPFRSGAEHNGRAAVSIDLRKVDDPDKNVRAPEVIGRSGHPIKDPREIYSGVRARVSLGVQTYAGQGGKEVRFGLNNVQKLGDGPPIAAGSIGEAGQCI